MFCVDNGNLECGVGNPFYWITWVFLQLQSWHQSDGTTGGEQLLDHWENLDRFPVLAQHLTEIVFGLDPMEVNDFGSYGFPDLVGCQCLIPLDFRPYSALLKTRMKHSSS